MITEPPTTLLPCPFCGSLVIEVMPNEYGEDFKATCISCLMRTYEYKTYAEVVKAWNTRTASVGADAADRIAKLIAREVNGGDREGCSYPVTLSALLDDPSIANEGAFAAWLRAIITPELASDPSSDAAEIVAEMAREAATIAARHASNFRESGFDIDLDSKLHHEARADALREAERRIRAASHE